MEIERVATEKIKDMVNNDIQKFDKLIELAEPIIEWLLKNYDCMCKVIIEDGNIEVIRTEARMPIDTKMN